MGEDQKSEIVPATKPEAEGDHQDKNRVNPPTLTDFLLQPEAVKAVEQLIINVIGYAHRGNNAQRIYQAIGLALIVAAVVGLSVYEKLDPSAGVILGSLAGYLFGKNRD